MGVEYEFVLEFPEILINAIGNVMYFISSNAGTYISLFLSIVLLGFLLWIINEIMKLTFKNLKKEYKKLNNVMP